MTSANTGQANSSASFLRETRESAGTRPMLRIPDSGRFFNNSFISEFGRTLLKAVFRTYTFCAVIVSTLLFVCFSAFSKKGSRNGKFKCTGPGNGCSVLETAWSIVESNASVVNSEQGQPGSKNQRTCVPKRKVWLMA